MKNYYCLIAGLLLMPLGCRSPQTLLPSLSRTSASYSHPIAEAVQPAETTNESGTIEEYVRLGLSRSLSLVEAQHKIDAIGYRIPQVLSLPDPMLNTNTYLAPVETAAGQQDFALGISQKYTNAERRATQAAIVSEELAAARANLAAIELEVAKDIRVACHQLLFLRAAIEITMDDQATLSQIADVIRLQYEVKASVTQQDVLNVQIEQSKLENELTELRQRERSYKARLARLLHVHPQSELTIRNPESVAVESLDVDALIDQALTARPDLQEQFAMVRRDRKKIHLAGLENKPDFTVGLNWIATSDDGLSQVANGDDALLLGIGFNLPVYKNRIRAAVCEAQANSRASATRLINLQDQVSEEVFDLVAKSDSARETLALVRDDIIPKSERTLDLSIEEYSNDSIDYAQLIENFRTLLRYRITEKRLESELAQALASLQRAVGLLTDANSE